MHCPFCSAVDTKVIDSRLVAGAIRCAAVANACSVTSVLPPSKWPNWSCPASSSPTAPASPFNEDKLRAGILRALEKRPVSMEAIEKAVNHIKSRLRATGEREVASQLVGNLVMDDPKSLDKVATSALPPSTAALKTFANSGKRSPSWRSNVGLSLPYVNKEGLPLQQRQLLHQ